MMMIWLKLLRAKSGRKNPEKKRQRRVQFRRYSKEKKRNREQGLMGRSMDPLMAEEQEAEQDLRFSVIRMTPDDLTKSTICYVEEGDLKGDDPVNTRSSDARFPMPPRGEGVNVSESEEDNLPLLAAYCQVDRSHFFFGGMLYVDHPVLYDSCYCYSQFVISASSPPAGSWEIRSTLLDLGNRHHFIAVPYDSKIYLFGNSGYDFLIYDPLRFTFSRRGPVPSHFGMKSRCMSYFIWPDNNPLILLQYRAFDFSKVSLLSYHVGDDCWEAFDPDFPCNKNNENLPLLLPGTNTLVIMDQIDSWRIYNVSTRELTGETVRVDGMRQHIVLQDPQYVHRRVIRSFCWRSCGTFLVFAFIEGCYDNGWNISCPREIAYAKIRLTPPPQGKRGGYVAAVESQGDLMVGLNLGAYISAEPSRKRKKEASSGHEEEED